MAHTSTTDAVSISNLTFKRQERPIFADLNLSIAAGKITAIMGPSGTGKTTLLQLIGGMLQPDAGVISVLGKDVAKLNYKELYKLRRTMGVLYQQGALFSDLNVYDNVAFPLREHTNLSDSMINDLVLLKLQTVGLRGAKNLLVSELSGGMARRAALARALVLDPSLLFYDEPFTGQDPITRGVLVQLIKRVNAALGLTSVVVTHDVPETRAVADEVYLLAEGRVIAGGATEAVFASEDPYVQQFLLGLPDGPVAFRYPAEPLNVELGVQT